VKSKVVLSLFTLVVPTLEVPHTATRAMLTVSFFLKMPVLQRGRQLSTVLSPNSTWLVTSRLDTIRHVRRVERVETSVSSRVRQLDTTKIHGLNTSNVSCRVETYRARWNLGYSAFLVYDGSDIVSQSKQMNASCFYSTNCGTL